MKRSSIAGVFAALACAALAAAFVPARADTIVNSFAALAGPASTCQWFDDHLNDRSIGALTWQTNLLYNRAALPAGAIVTVGQRATTARGATEVSFDVGHRLLCASDEAFVLQTPAPSPTPVTP